MRNRVLATLMTFCGLALPALTLAADDEPALRPYFALMGTYVEADNRRDGEFGGGLHFTVGFPFPDHLHLELNGFGNTLSRRSNDDDASQYGLSLDVAYFLRPGRFTPFALIEAGALLDDEATDEEVLPFLGLGGGLHLPFTRAGTGLRADLRWITVFDEDIVPGEDDLHDIRINLGVQIAFPARRRGAARSELERYELPEPVEADVEFNDADRDGVADAGDRCPETPLLARVDRLGCEYDGDRDGIVDGSDACPDTRPGVPIDKNGCAFDSDRDGVPNYEDQCPRSRAGALVNALGCETDDDSDGVPNSADRCPNTASGQAVDAAGCALKLRPADSDGDGVADTGDACPDTAPGVRVDARGCVVQQRLTVPEIQFEYKSFRLTAEARARLDQFVATLRGQSDLHVEVAGHTDSIGSDSYNLGLSEKRARAVRSYLVQAGIAARRLAARGYGEREPVADNSTEAGRARNRRVELRLSRR